MKRYDSYKDSGVGWIGDIPSHWRKSKFKFVSELYTGNSLNDSQKLKYESDDPKDIPYVSSKDIDVDYQTVNYDNGLRIPKDENPLKISPKGSFLMVIEGGSSGRKMVFLEQDVCFVNKLCSFNSVENTKFQYYFIQSSNYQDKFRLSLSGLIGGVSISNLKDFELTLPPLSEQQQIVTFLDTKTSLIDSLIEKTQRKIELLKEKRTSLINEVVTKGLNPNVEMKDSGVEWIGEIPSGWDFVKVGHYTHVVRGGSPRPSGDPKFFNGDFIHWITVKDITSKSDKYVVSTETKLTEEGMKQSRVLEPETLVLTNSGATLGIPGILKIKGCINDGSVGFLNVSQKVERDYLYYFWTTQTKLLLEQQSGYGQPNLNIEIVSNVRFPLPPLNEQQQIVEYLDGKNGIIDKTISIEEKRIKLLKEYRQSLISEVVTGKLKVVE
ncbi:restriction endonuclease subunit S [Schleiferiaceae bacterium]|nr:restriction endonuclease subunit S [Schleiferiaceae bacterium]